MTLALIVAAGSGERLAAGRPKALVQLAGRPLYEWSLLALRATAGVERIVIALPGGVEDVAGLPGFDGADAGSPSVLAAPGGATRSESVRRALAAAGAGDPVLVHDAARPLLTPAIAHAVISALEASPQADAAIAAAPVSDTIKRAGGDRVVRETLERAELWSVQTPQVFRRAALEQALDVGERELAAATDDAWLIERRGGQVLVVPTGAENLKVTTPVDLELAALLLERRAAGALDRG